MPGESFSILVFLLEPVNVAYGRVCEIGCNRVGLIIGVVELSANSICGISECEEKMSHNLKCFFFVDYHVRLTNSSMLFTILVLLTYETSVLQSFTNI